MYLIDTHTHLYHKQFDGDRSEIIKHAIQLGVKKFFLPNIDTDSISGMQALTQEFPSVCYAMYGLHPGNLEDNYQEQLNSIHEILLKNKETAIAVGEIGLDLFWRKDNLPQQLDAFEQQINWALELNLPIVIHSRDALVECLELVEKYSSKGLRGVFHCFGGSVEEANRIFNAGFYVGIGGTSTYKTSTLADVLRVINRERVILETDAPFLPPVPHRGKRNEPSFLPLVANLISACWGLTVRETAEITTSNALTLFDRAN